MLSVVLFTLLFILGGVNTEVEPLVHTIAVCVLASLVYTSLHNKAILKFPQGSEYFIIFLSFVALSFLWSKNIFAGIQPTITLVEGAVLFVYAFNNKKYFEKFLPFYILITTAFYFLFYLLTVSGLINMSKYFSLFYQDYDANMHIHLGDLAALWLIYFAFNLNKNFKLTGFLAVLVGAVFVFLSNSRTAVIMILVSLFLMQKNRINISYLKYLTLICFVVFLYMSWNKSLLFSRPYFLQSIFGLSKYPFGVGLGNFDKVSEAFGFGIPEWWDFSKYAHNIFLEMLSALGIFSAPFYIWFVIGIKRLLAKIKKGMTIPQILFIALTVNFLFDLTYSIPPVLWLWFILFGLALSSKKNKTYIAYGDRGR